MMFIVNSHIPEGLPLRSNKAIYVPSSICVRQGRDEGSSLVASLAAWSAKSLPFIPTMVKQKKAIFGHPTKMDGFSRNCRQEMVLFKQL